MKTFETTTIDWSKFVAFKLLQYFTFIRYHTVEVFVPSYSLYLHEVYKQLIYLPLYFVKSSVNHQ